MRPSSKVLLCQVFVTCPLHSTAGHRVIPYSAAHFYTATKHAVRAITEGLRQELREMKSGIKVTVSIYFAQLPSQLVNVCCDIDVCMCTLCRVSLLVLYVLNLLLE